MVVSGFLTAIMSIGIAYTVSAEPITFEAGAIPNDYYEIVIGEEVDLGKNDNENEYILYDSSDDTVVTVDDYGVAEAVKEGTAIITRKGKAGTTTYLIKVVKENQTKVNVTGVLYTEEKKEAPKYVITLLKEDTALQQTTDDQGKFQFSDLKAGEYLILVQDQNQNQIVASGRISFLNNDPLELHLSQGNISAKYTPEIKMQQIKLDKEEAELFEGEQLQLIWTLSPSNVTNPSLRFYSSDSSVATVDENGYVVAVKKGVALISAANADGTVVQSCMVTVKSKWASFIILSVQMGLIILVILGFSLFYRRANKKYKQKITLDEET